MSRRQRALCASAVTTVLLAIVGCGTVKRTATTRSATEQLLLTNAWDDAIRKVDFRDLTGVPVYLEVGNVAAIDKEYIISSLRQSMLTQGVLIRQKPEQAQWIVEARVGVYGTDEWDKLVGISQTTIPQTFTGMPSGTIPEIPLIKKSEQQAMAKLALFAYDRGSGRMVWSSGTMLATQNTKDVHVFGVGPIQSGSLYQNKEKRIGVNIPLLSDPTPNPGAGAPAVKSGSQSMAMPISPSDSGSFAP